MRIKQRTGIFLDKHHEKKIYTMEGIPFLCGRFPEYDSGENAVVYHFDQTLHYVLPVEAYLFPPFFGTV
jgi:hypothetical protein